MITKDLKISKMLDEYPETLQVMVNASSLFNKLNNRVLRKTLASRVTVEQAASIADIDLADLIKQLNDKIGIKIENQTTQNESKKMNEPLSKSNSAKPILLENISQEKIKILDVRPIISSGQDPLKNIISFVKELKSDEVMLLINTFEPVPLYSVLNNKGFTHWTEIKDNLFHVYFFKDVDSEFPQAKSSADDKNKNYNISGEEKIIELDVRGLEPPQPMIKILETLSQIDENSILVVHHHKEPLMLYGKLEERGFQAISNKIEENYFKVIISMKR